MTDMNRLDRPRRRRLSGRAWIATLLLLAGIGIERGLLGQPSLDSRAYHAGVRAAAEQMPFAIGSWLGVEEPIPQGAIKLLQPNVMLSRRYREMETGRQATLLLIHCQDARDMLGHFPPACYVRQGWVMESSTPRDWEVDGRSIRATRYLFRGGGDDLPRDIVIDNFMLLPTGQTARDMTEVDQAARDPVLKHFGAGQVQIISDGSMPEADRQEVFQTLIGESQAVLDMILMSVVEK